MCAFVYCLRERIKVSDAIRGEHLALTGGEKLLPGILSLSKLPNVRRVANPLEI
jgi:hypothetical protein